MTTQFPEDPLSHIKTWQNKFKEHKQQCEIAEMNEPLISKDSRENLHNTKNATDAIKDWRTFWSDVIDESKDNFEDELFASIKQRTINDFLDSITCALEEMSGEEVFNCFVEAAQTKHDYTQKEHYKTNELFNLLLAAKKFKYD
jgi:hypothetical protein